MDMCQHSTGAIAGSELLQNVTLLIISLLFHRHKSHHRITSLCHMYALRHYLQYVADFPASVEQQWWIKLTHYKCCLWLCMPTFVLQDDSLSPLWTTAVSIWYPLCKRHSNSSVDEFGNTLHKLWFLKRVTYSFLFGLWSLYPSSRPENCWCYSGTSFTSRISCFDARRTGSRRGNGSKLSQELAWSERSCCALTPFCLSQH